jgi:RNA polymerase sigma-70 factor, ECF subfamily
MLGLPAANAASDDPECDGIDLVRRLKAGDRAAFTSLVDRYLMRVFRFCYSILKDRSLAEDAAQEAFLRLWQNAQKLDESGQVQGWILRIAHNICIDEIRRRKPEYGVEETSSFLPPVAATQDVALQDGYVAQTLQQALFKLPDRQRTALVLVYYNDVSNIEAADIMNVSVDALESLLARGKRGLHVLLSSDKQDLMEG